LRDAAVGTVAWPAALLYGCGPWGQRAAAAVPDHKPNIILILADDLGYGDLGCYGQRLIRTPNLDRMAAQGVRFTQAYAGSTVCAPSRCCLMTGRHTGHCTVRGNVDVLMRPDEPTCATVLKQAGYTTACIGKWGIGHPPPPDDPHEKGFDHFFGYLSMWHAHNYYPEFLWRDGRKVPLRNVVEHPETHNKPGQAALTGRAREPLDYAPDLFTAEALEFIDGRKEPFFLFLSYTIPHANNEAGRFGAHGMEVPHLGPYARADWPEPEKAKAAMISRMDGDIGRLRDHLRRRGIEGNTLVIFTSDNGPHREGRVDPAFFDSNGPLRGIKRDLYEGGLRVPFIACWPGTIAPGRTCEHVAAFWDLLPTFAELAGRPIPPGVDGLSMVPSLLGLGTQKEHEYLYWEFHEGRSQQALRLGPFKLVRPGPSAPIQVYDLRTDLSERHDIAADRPDLVARARALFQQARTDPDRWPLKDGP